MPRKSLPCLAIAAISLLISACSPTPSPGPSGLEINFSGQNEGQPPCRIERTARVDQGQHALYMVRGVGRYQIAEGRTRSIPIQIQFRATEGIVEETSITLTELEAHCKELTIDLSIETCQNQDRNRIECPPFEINGEDNFKALDLSIGPG